jgi:hypothetical protein
MIRVAIELGVVNAAASALFAVLSSLLTFPFDYQ